MHSAFCKLADPAAYVACSWDLSRDAEGRAAWTALFRRHIEIVLAMGEAVARERGESSDSAERRAGACRLESRRMFDAFESAPAAHGRVTVLTLVGWRDGALRRNGFEDAFVDLKRRENEKMLPLLPALCREIDAIGDPREQFRAIIEGVFAGNIFDMGAEATAKAFLTETPPAFLEVRSKLPRRPWVIDDYDALETRLLNEAPHRKVVYFVDNAGSDFLLGALPMMRWLARRGTRVVLAANQRPTLNDMTVHDVHEWWPRILEAEPSLRGMSIEIVSTGTGEPLIDLSAVSDELNAAAADADLVILEGMGRGVESNLDARFNCDALNIAMLKDDLVAGHVGGKLFDLVCRFRRCS